MQMRKKCCCEYLERRKEQPGWAIIASVRIQANLKALGISKEPTWRATHDFKVDTVKWTMTMVFATPSYRYMQRSILPTSNPGGT